MVFSGKTPKREQVAMAIGDETSLGHILIDLGYATPEQVQAAITRQLMTAPPIGEILIEMGVITPEQLEAALYAQRKARGEVSNKDEVQHHLAQQAQDIRQIADSLTEIAGISNGIAEKLGRPK